MHYELKTTDFLWHQITEDGAVPPTSKLKAVLDFPQPVKRCCAFRKSKELCTFTTASLPKLLLSGTSYVRLWKRDSVFMAVKTALANATMHSHLLPCFQIQIQILKWHESTVDLSVAFWPSWFCTVERHHPKEISFWIQGHPRFGWWNLHQENRLHCAFDPCNHHGIIKLFLIHSSSSPGVLGSLWLADHNPMFDWLAGWLTYWSISCKTNRFCSALSSSPSSLEPLPKVSDLSTIPAECHYLGEEFSKDRALFLPHHQPYDCGIDLLSRAPRSSAQGLKVRLFPGVKPREKQCTGHKGVPGRDSHLKS